MQAIISAGGVLRSCTLVNCWIQLTCDRTVHCGASHKHVILQFQDSSKSFPQIQMLSDRPGRGLFKVPWFHFLPSRSTRQSIRSTSDIHVLSCGQTEIHQQFPKWYLQRTNGILVVVVTHWCLQRFTRIFNYNLFIVDLLP